MQCLPQLNKALRCVRSQLSDLPPSEFELETNVKPYVSVKRKMQENKAKHPTELSDLVRGRIFFSDQFEHKDALDILQQLFGDKIKNVDKNTSKSTEHGLEYLGIMHIDLDLDGVNFELQVMPAEFKPYKEFLHGIYEKLRDEKTRNKLSDKQKELLRKVHNNLYKKLNDLAHKNRSND